MNQFISKAVLCLFSLAALCSLAYGQDIPAVTSAPTFQGFELPTENGSLHYALSASERVRTGYYGTGGNVWSTDFSGDLGFLSRSVSHPFSMVYSGGYLHNSDSVGASVFQNLALSQTLTTRLFTFNISDSLSYLPESPSSGLSGIPGVGDVGVTNPPLGGDPGQDILSRNGQRINNETSVSAQRQLTGSTGLQLGGGYYILRFLDGGVSGVDGQSISGQTSVNHRLDALSSIQGNYSYTHVSYEDQDSTLSTHSATIGYTRQVNRRLNVHASIGPQFVSSAGTSFFTSAAGTRYDDSSLNFSVDSGLGYNSRNYEISALYARGVRAGSGVVQGAFSDSLGVSAGRRLGEYLHLSASGSYTHNSSVSNRVALPLDFQTTVGNAQISRTISATLNAFVSYSVQHQSSSNGSATSTAFTGISQVFGFGITYSPRPLHIGHQ